MTIQTITTASGERLVVLPEEDYRRLVEAAEDASDAQIVEAFRDRLAHGFEELVPANVADRLLDGENAIKVWRDHRGLSSKALAESAGIAQAFLSQIENGRREGTVETLQRLADVLKVSLDDLVGAPASTKIIGLLEVRPHLTVAEIASELHYSEGHVGRVCNWLKDVKKSVTADGSPQRWSVTKPAG